MLTNLAHERSVRGEAGEPGEHLEGRHHLNVHEEPGGMEVDSTLPLSGFCLDVLAIPEGVHFDRENVDLFHAAAARAPVRAGWVGRTASIGVPANVPAALLSTIIAYDAWQG